MTKLITSSIKVCVGASRVSISNVSPYQSTPFKDNGEPASEFPTPTIQPISPDVSCYNQAPTSSKVLVTHVSAISPNTIISEHVPSGWVQMPNYSNHSTPPVLKSHHKQYVHWTENEHRYIFNEILIFYFPHFYVIMDI